jgi:hypothetical protein
MKNKESNTGRETATSARGSQRVSRDRMVAKKYPSPLAWLPQVAAVLASLLKEIFDESAYSRFLERNRVSSSATAYAAFREENERLKAQRPRCC